MKKVLILSAFVFASFITMAQSKDSLLIARTKVMVDSTSLLIDSSDHTTCDVKESNMLKSSTKSSHKSTQVAGKSRSEHTHSSAVFRRRNGSL